MEMEKEEHIKYGPDSTSQMEKEREKDRESIYREKNAEKERSKKREGERKKWRERNARNIEKKSARSCQEQDREEGEYNVNKIIYSCLRFLTKRSKF